MLGGQLRCDKPEGLPGTDARSAEGAHARGDPRIVIDRGLAGRHPDLVQRGRHIRARGAGLGDASRREASTSRPPEGPDQLPEIVRGSQRVSESAKRTLNRRTRPIIGITSRPIVSITPAQRMRAKTYMGEGHRLAMSCTNRGRDTYAATRDRQNRRVRAASRPSANPRLVSGSRGSRSQVRPRRRTSTHSSSRVPGRG